MSDLTYYIIGNIINNAKYILMAACVAAVLFMVLGCDITLPTGHNN